MLEKTKNYFLKYLFILIDFILIFLSLFLSFEIRFYLDVPPYYIQNIILYFFIFALIKIFLLKVFNIYKIIVKNIGIIDLYNVLKASFTSSVIIFILFTSIRIAHNQSSFFIPLSYFPISVIIIDFLLFTMLIGISRTITRSYNEIFLFNKIKNRKYKTLVIGAGNAGEKIVRDIFKSPVKTKFNPVGYIDDDEEKHYKTTNGIKILGGIENFTKIIKKFSINNIIIAMPSAHQSVIRNYINICIENKIHYNHIYIVPPVIENLDRKISINNLREIQPEDILGREEFDLPQGQAITNELMNKTVMITGAGGSIGSTLVRKVSLFKPKLLILFEIDETEIFFLIQMLNKSFPDMEIMPVVGDIRDEQKIRSIFDKVVPDIILHAAAYKHVPIMESNVDEAVINNIYGTDILCRTSMEFGVDKFILISTDKAVEPSSIMGATKRIAEAILIYYNKLTNKTKFAAVRFGNVLGSRGSVIPIFKEQIKNGEQLTITHPEMERYLMSIDEASLLILFSLSIMGSAGFDLFFLEMGKKIKILDIANTMIKFYGLEPDKDIKIIYTGIRPGEKLTEEILYEKEKFENTTNKKIYRITNKENYDQSFFKEKLDELINAAWIHNDMDGLKNKISNIISYINQ
jgi:FlaA1/EpsC-like NDP-sugar epimerase